MEAVGALLVCGAGLVGRAFAVVALDDQTHVAVDHVEVANRVVVGFQHVLPVAARPLLGLHIEFEHAQVLLATHVFVGLGRLVPQRAFEQGVELAAVLAGGHAFKALGALHVKRRGLGVRGTGHEHAGRVGRAHDLAVHLGVEHGQHLAVQVGLDEVGAKLFRNPQRATGELEALGVEVRARQVALVGAFLRDAEGHFLVGVVQEDGLLAAELAALEVHGVVAQVQHEVGRVGLGASAVVRQQPETAVGHALDAGMALHRLAIKGQADAGGAACRQTHHRAQLFHALGGGELASVAQVGRGVCGRGNHGECCHHGMAGERGRKGLLRVGRGQCGADQGSASGKVVQRKHGGLPEEKGQRCPPGVTRA